MTKINSNIEKYRASLRMKLADYEGKLIEVENELQTLYPKYKEKTQGKSFFEVTSIYTEMLLGSVNLKKQYKHNIDAIKTELIENKYANKKGFSDITPFEVIEERTPNLYVIREMTFEQTEESKEKVMASFEQGGFNGHYDNFLQDWNITPKEDGLIIKIRKHRDGFFYDSMKNKYEISETPVRFNDFNF